MTDEEHEIRRERSCSPFIEDNEDIEKRIQEALDKKFSDPEGWTGRDEHWLQKDGYALGANHDRERDELMAKLYAAVKR